jgi:hypothetical protein
VRGCRKAALPIGKSAQLLPGKLAASIGFDTAAQNSVHSLAQSQEREKYRLQTLPPTHAVSTWLSSIAAATG